MAVASSTTPPPSAPTGAPATAIAVAPLIPAVRPAEWGGSRGAIFVVQIVFLLLLGALAGVYFVDRQLLSLPDSLGPIPLPVPWFGALGAVLISLTGVVEHHNDWDPAYRFWHWSRPVVGAAFGTIGILGFQSGILAVGSTPAGTGNVPRNLLYYLVAFLIGYREETFRLMMKRLTDLIVTTGLASPAPTVSSITPETGISGTPVTILGMELGNTQSVRFGNTPAPFTGATAGQVSTIAPPAPIGTVASIVVTTKAGAASAGKFTYAAPPDAKW